MLVKPRLAPGNSDGSRRSPVAPDELTNDEGTHDKDEKLREDIDKKHAILVIQAQFKRTAAECDASDCQGDILGESNSSQNTEKRIISPYCIFVMRNDACKCHALLPPACLFVPYRLIFSHIGASFIMSNALSDFWISPNSTMSAFV